MTKFGIKCREAGLTAYRISKDTGVLLPTVANWMTGRAMPTAGDNLAAVVEYCANKGIDIVINDFLPIKTAKDGEDIQVDAPQGE